MEKKKIISRQEQIMKACFYIIIGIFAIACLFPFLLMITSSFMSEKEIVSEGYKLIPKTISFSAYAFLFSNFTNLLNAYKVTIFIAVVGTVLGLLFMSMAGWCCRAGS